MEQAVLFWELMLDILEMKSLKSWIKQTTGSLTCWTNIIPHAWTHSWTINTNERGEEDFSRYLSVRCYLLTEGRVQKCHTNLQSSLRIKVKCHGQTRCWTWALFHCQPLFHTRRALCAPHWSKLSKSHMMSRAQNTGNDVRGPFLWHWLFVIFFQIFSLFRDKYPACEFPEPFDLATVLYYLPRKKRDCI